MDTTNLYEHLGVMSPKLMLQNYTNSENLMELVQKSKKKANVKIIEDAVKSP